MTLTSEEAIRVLERSELLYTATDVESALDRMAEEITERLEGKTPLVLCVMIGGLVAAGRLLPKLAFPLEVDYLHATRYRGNTEGGDLHWIARPRASLRGRDVLIIDDILDEGHTLAGIVDSCCADGAKAVHTAVLVNKNHDRRYRDLQADVVGLQVEDRYVFGAGMDYKSFLRNIPEIFAAPDD